MVDRGTIPNAVGIGIADRDAAVSAVPGGNWTRTLIVPCGRVACAATWPLICCATKAANVWMFRPDAASLSVGTSWYCGLEATRFDFSSARPATRERAVS